MPDLLEPFRSTSSWWIIAVGALTNVACALVGCYLVLRRMSLMGDAIAHAVLPGLALAFILTGSLSVGPMLLGAAAVGLLTTFLTQTLHEYGRLPADASMGVVFTSLFALGVVLIKRYVSGIHFDAACVYEGSLQFVALDAVEVGGLYVPRTLLTIGPVLIVSFITILFLWKELKISAFDPALSTAMGYSATFMHYLLMVLVAITTVASFEAVGSILVVSMLIVPPATAQLFCDRLSRMMALACVIAVATSVMGYWLAYLLNVNPAGAMAVTAGGFYTAAVLFAPRYGILSTLVRNAQTSLRIVSEDILSMLYKIEEVAAERALERDDVLRAVGGGMVSRWALSSLLRSGSIRPKQQGFQLTDTGRQTAKQLVRTHRLWEAYLVEHLGLALDHVHEPADRVEHFIDERMQRELEQSIADKARDPHGRDIPQ